MVVGASRHSGKASDYNTLRELAIAFVAVVLNLTEQSKTNQAAGIVYYESDKRMDEQYVYPQAG